MKKTFLALMLVVMGLISTVHAQNITASVLLKSNVTIAKQNDLINVHVFVNSPDERIAGADIEVSVDPLCLRIERLDVGEYLPTTEGQGFIVKQEQNEISARLVVTVLSVNLSAQGEGIYMSLPVRVMCESGVAQVNITRSELVDDLTNQFTAQTQSIELNIQSNVPNTSQVSTTVGGITPISDNEDNILLVAILVIVTSGFGLVILMMVYRRKKSNDKKLALAKKSGRR
jgi:hypothetical protein